MGGGPGHGPARDGVLEAMRCRCARHRPRRLRRRPPRGARRRARGGDPMRPTSPYRGLAPFEDTELDELFFFGRERDRKVIAANLVASRLTVLYGPSGVGKSSALGAGVA